MKIVTIQPRQPDIKDALEVIDQLRAQIVDGRCIAFSAVSIEPDDTTTAWCSSTQPVSRLRMMGAITSLLHGYIADL